MGQSNISVKARISFALAVATASCVLVFWTQGIAPGHSDFSIIRAAILSGTPYKQLPGYDFVLHYPGTALAFGVPFTWVSERVGDLIFVALSTGLLAFGLTKDGWDRIWILPSAAFIVAIRSGQWSPLVASAYFLPLGIVSVLKPSTGLASLSVQDRRGWIVAIVGGFILFALSFAVYTKWIPEWLGTLRGSWEFVAPVRRLGGFLLILSLLRWRSKEGRFLFVLSMVPQVSSWYEGLLPMLVGRTKRECQVLSLTSSLGYLLMIPLALQSPTHEIASSTVGRMMVAFCYLPALIVVLRREN